MTGQLPELGQVDGKALSKLKQTILLVMEGSGTMPMAASCRMPKKERGPKAPFQNPVALAFA
ncbi:hypothetical protein [Lysobacter sp. D1-1-M9]|uniref:hypothetical protein n=1 Tax=Novilysobacter longmucuonensis TaxID=3098603 RepID=UPI002FC62EE4